MLFRSEVEALNGSRSFLHCLEDEEVLEPERLIWKLTNKQRKQKSVWPITAVAASLTLLLLVGYFTNFNVSYGGFELAFASPQQVELPQTLTNTEVQAMINKSIIANNVEFVTQIEEAKSELETKLTANNKLQLQDMRRIAASNQKLPKAQVDAYLSQLGDANRTLINDFFVASALEQQDYMQTILADFFEYMNNQRKDDFRVLQANIEDVAYKSDLKLQQIDQILSTILTRVGNASMGQ